MPAKPLRAQAPCGGATCGDEALSLLCVVSFLDLCGCCKGKYFCYYSATDISTCAGNGVHEIWMRGRVTDTNLRVVCGPCLAWVTRDELADLVVDTSPVDDHVLTGHGAAEVVYANLAEVRFPL